MEAGRRLFFLEEEEKEGVGVSSSWGGSEVNGKAQFCVGELEPRH